MTSTETDDFKVMLSESQPTLTKESVAGELPKLKNVAHGAFPQSFEVPNSVLVGKTFCNEELERVEEEKDRLVEEGIAYK